LGRAYKVFTYALVLKGAAAARPLPPFDLPLVLAKDMRIKWLTFRCTSSA